MNIRLVRCAQRARFVVRPMCVAACMASLPGAWALPQDASPTFGSTQVLQTTPGQMLIQQGSDRAGLNWQSFSIGAGERVRVVQPGSTSVLFNRVIGQDPSLILGQLQANGRVFLSNARGIVFGAGSQVDAAGLVATTLDLADAAAQAGRYELTRGVTQPGLLVMDGTVNAPGGTVALVAPTLSVGGVINAGRVGLAAATDVLVDVEGDGLIFFNARNDGLDDPAVAAGQRECRRRQRRAARGGARQLCRHRAQPRWRGACAQHRPARRADRDRWRQRRHHPRERARWTPPARRLASAAATSSCSGTGCCWRLRRWWMRPAAPVAAACAWVATSRAGTPNSTTPTW